ncbi:DEAD/DEAH box helicase [Mycolicibacterium austroafricanum]|uniref:DNA 3'-5' helicase n=1 Tax=Mycolicibacterium austroafricanum TaxID=39687 RepID=A0ABT8HBL0_MYCAO|nr:DEAD/DEAH box helicase [Mycolicibacterium austroafricanum]MDN4517925.1 DEAD/DEAH box helicase [Mycolicibacterium austroafricanum]PQP40945.1 recombinase RecQ [Mycolicibacterium austroafricanum]QRZ06307.1 RecQ family ATP-dependent DNA helicase [Mycolicibacterium austroafricanum]QZT56404.1 DEAD/DEAH box helicase [Mycolicibacterium austroafricanum]QZT67782.1 DEAD/DEAH box helicase [Mycolicibacterium austroafricanum]
MTTRADAQAILEQLAGPGAVLRDDQWTAIEALVVHRRRALVVQRTGWGKSAVYFISAKLLRAAGHGPTVIVSPLLALMRNQVAAADRAGVHAATINSSNVTDWAEIHDRVRSGDLDVLLVSPERLNNPDFRDQVLPSLAHDAGLVVVDEAHCVSDWGHDFRPDYRRIRTLLADLGADVPVLATTATANDRVVADVAAQLGVGDFGREEQDGGSDTLVLRGGLDRESLRLSVVNAGNPAQRAAWLVAQLDSLPGSGIVYTLTVAQAHDVASLLAEQGHKVAAYTGATEASEREQLESDLLDNRVKALIATSALGMGFDKPDLGFVVHLGAPSSPIAYYQQVGRAGRSTASAEVILLPGREDQEVWRYFASVAFPSESMVRNVIGALETDRPQSTAALEPLVDLNRSRLEMVLKVLDVDGAVRRVKGGWVATGRPWAYDEQRYRTLDEARRREQQAMLDYQSTDGCRMAFLRRQLDDPELGADERCGRCDNCAGSSYSADVDAAVAEDSRQRLMRPGVEISPRKQWPSGLAKLGVDLSGRITDGPAPGRVIGRLTDLGWGARLRTLLEQDDAEVPDDVVQAAVKVLAAWDWQVRPTAVMALDSDTHPLLTSSLARRLAELGRLTDLGVLRYTPERRPVTAANSAYRVAALRGAWESPDPDAISAAGGPVLLVDAMTDTGWTLTMAARVVRSAGAPAVLPFALAATS